MALLSLATPDAARYAPGTYHTDGQRLIPVEIINSALPRIANIAED